MQKGTDHITIPYIADDKMVEDLVSQAFTKIKPKG
jgi:hypothetical protein